MAKTKANVENAQKVLNELQAKQTELTASRAHDQTEMAAIAYAAHTGCEKSAAKLETLQARAIKRDVEARNLDSAIEEARRRVAAAQNDERSAEELKVAEELLELSQIMREAGARRIRRSKPLSKRQATLKR